MQALRLLPVLFSHGRWLGLWMAFDVSFSHSPAFATHGIAGLLF
jgi:hypothetical protein